MSAHTEVSVELLQNAATGMRVGPGPVTVTGTVTVTLGTRAPSSSAVVFRTYLLRLRYVIYSCSPAYHVNRNPGKFACELSQSIL